VASAPRVPGASGRLSGLVAELRPRWKELRYSLHLLRKSLLAMVGLAIVGVFLFLAVFGPALAPYPYVYNASEKNSPPGARPTVLRNTSALDGEAAGWTTPASFNDILSTSDGRRAMSYQVGDTLELRRFNLKVYSDDVLQVGVSIQYNATAGSTDDVLNVSVSWDNGTSWSPRIVTPFRDVNASAAWSFLDFTNVTRWTASRLDDTTFVVRIEHARSGSPPGGIGVDVLRVVVRFKGLYHILGTTVDGEDVLTGVLLGARISIRIGVIVVFVATMIGSILGALAGYFGGPLDELVMRITDVFLSIPGLILALAVAAALGQPGQRDVRPDHRLLAALHASRAGPGALRAGKPVHRGLAGDRRE